MLPKNIVLVRHGESEGNLVRHGSASGVAVHDRLDCDWRLTDKGRAQAEAAGAWLREQFTRGFRRHYVSDYVRAKETAVHLALPNAVWLVDPALRERDYGVLDVLPPEQVEQMYPDNVRIEKANPFYWRPPEGESIADLIIRLRAGVIDGLHGECADDDVLIVCHGQVMWAMVAMLTRMLPARFNELARSKDPHDRMQYCQIIRFTREDPEGGRVERYLKWMRWSCPGDPSLSRDRWEQIERPLYTNEDLRAQVETIAPLT